MEITTTILITIIAGALGTILANYLWKYLRKEVIKTKRIKSLKNKHIEGLIELYTNLFPDDGTNYSGSEILEFIDLKNYNSNRHIVAENIVLVSLFKSEVIGFVFCHFYPSKKKAIISYLGINKKIDEAKQYSAKMLFSLLKRILTKNSRKCEYLFFDILKPEKSVDEIENSQRKARNTLFKIRAKSMGYQAYEFGFDYKSPKISISDYAHEQNLILMCIPFNTKFDKYISKNLLLSFLEFIHLDCYGDLYTIDDLRFPPHQKHLKQKCDRYRTILPEQILVN